MRWRGFVEPWCVVWVGFTKQAMRRYTRQAMRRYVREAMRRYVRVGSSVATSFSVGWREAGIVKKSDRWFECW